MTAQKIRRFADPSGPLSRDALRRATLLVFVLLVVVPPAQSAADSGRLRLVHVLVLNTSALTSSHRPALPLRVGVIARRPARLCHTNRVAEQRRRYGSSHQRARSSSTGSNGSARTRSLPPCVLATTQRWASRRYTSSVFRIGSTIQRCETPSRA